MSSPRNVMIDGIENCFHCTRCGARESFAARLPLAVKDFEKIGKDFDSRHRACKPALLPGWPIQPEDEKLLAEIEGWIRRGVGVQMSVKPAGRLVAMVRGLNAEVERLRKLLSERTPR